MFANSFQKYRDSIDAANSAIWVGSRIPQAPPSTRESKERSYYQNDRGAQAPAVQFELRDVLATGYPNDHFDGISCIRLFHHFDEADTRRRALGELRRICRGPIVVTLAIFWQGWGFSRGAIVARAVPPRYSIADLLESGEFQEMAADRRDSLIEAAADVVARLRRAHISWRSMKAKHCYPEETAPGVWRIWLIDCEGVYRRASSRDCQREWREFLRYITARAPGMRDAFLAAYSPG